MRAKGGPDFSKLKTARTRAEDQRVTASPEMPSVGAEVSLAKLRERLRLMTDEELIKFGKQVRALRRRHPKDNS